MPASMSQRRAEHPHPWRKAGWFDGIGLHRPLHHVQRRSIRDRLHHFAFNRQITRTHEAVLRAALKRVGQDGQCTPSHQTLANDTGASVSTVRRALERAKQLGLLVWVQRLARDAFGVFQTSNAYKFNVPEGPPAPVEKPAKPRKSWGVQKERETQKAMLSLPSTLGKTPEMVPLEWDIAAARLSVPAMIARRTAKAAEDFWKNRPGRGLGLAKTA